MRTLINTLDPSRMLVPAMQPGDARQNAIAVAPNLTVVRGRVLGVKTSDNLAYGFVAGAGDGTQLYKALSMYDFKTDATGLVYFGDVNVASWYQGPNTLAPVWESGIFDPATLTTGTLVAEVDTFTPGGTITTGDIDKLTYTRKDLTTKVASFTVGATTTAAAVSAGLIAAWNADPELAAVATATGTNTVVLTAVVPGDTFSVASSVTGVGTLTRAATTAATGRVMSDLLTACPGSRLMTNGFIKLP
jgi:hypothetical protein